VKAHSDHVTNNLYKFRRRHKKIRGPVSLVEPPGKFLTEVLPRDDGDAPWWWWCRRNLHLWTFVKM